MDPPAGVQLQSAKEVAFLFAVLPADPAIQGEHTMNQYLNAWPAKIVPEAERCQTRKNSNGGSHGCGRFAVSSNARVLSGDMLQCPPRSAC